MLISTTFYLLFSKLLYMKDQFIPCLTNLTRMLIISIIQSKIYLSSNTI